ncbi:hypothetical protein GGI17_005399 [Coemansia sp. S146]|nr:hypothetical protein GGI17_005399 [Coemansia sp. S146]
MDLVIHSDDEDDTDDEQASTLEQLCGCFHAHHTTAALFHNDVRGDRKTSSPGDQINISAFMQRVMEMAPMVSDIQVTSICNYIPPEINSPNLINLISQLFRLVTRVEFTIVNISDMPVTLYLNDIRDLVHIKYTTLEKSDGIFQNADGGYITYPRLHALKLADMAGIHDPAQLVSRGAVPFPRLRHIQLKSYNPFGGDVLFRGNAASLESLDMQLSIIDADMLHTYRVFTPTSHPKLKYVKVSVWSSTYYTTAKDLQLGLVIGIEAPVREIIQSVSGFKLGPAFMSVGDYAYIRFLILPSLNLHLLDALIVIKSLPILSDLHTSFPIIGITPPAVALDDLPMYIVSIHAPMGERF